MSRNTTPKEPILVIGGMPKADLLPPEIKAGEKARAQRRGLLAVFALVLLIVGGAYAGVTFLAQSAQGELDAANARSAQIIAEQAKYAEVSQAQQGIAAVEAARLTAMATEIDWGTELEAVMDTLPDGSDLSALTVSSTTPVVSVATPSSPLEGGRVAELQLTVLTNGLPNTAKWVRDLSELEGFVDATPTSITTTEGVVTTVVTLHLNSAVYWNRFVETEDTK